MAEPDHVSTARSVYDFSADQYVNAVGTTISPASENSLDRAVLDAFANDLNNGEPALVLDLGCGPGRIAAYLYERGIRETRGFDLSPQMITAARTAHPHLTFDVAPLTNLPVESGSATAAVLWYSIIHTPLPHLAEVWAELKRVLQPSGRALIGFQAGNNEEVQRENAYGSSATLTWYRHAIDDVASSIENAGFDVTARIWRKAELTYESTPQAFLVVRSPS